MSRVVEVRHGGLQITQHVRVSGRLVGTDVAGPICLYARIQVRSGSVTYLSGNSTVPVEGCCDVFVPPFTLVQAVLEQCDVTTMAFAFPCQDGLPAEPLLFRADNDRLGCPSDAVKRLRTGAPGTYIGRVSVPGADAARAKAILDAEYASPIDISGIAERLRVSPSNLSRAFKRAYGLPPVQYRHHVRIVDALFRLAEGAVPLQVFQDVGFDDLSRFYKIFRKVACASPAAYRPLSARNAKTQPHL